MKILFLGNNQTALHLLRWLKEQGEEIAGLVIHPESTAKYSQEIIQASGLPRECIFEAGRLQEAPVRHALASLKIDLGLSIFFGYILSEDFVRMFPRGVMNLHPSYLPYNRGQYPNVWSIVEGTPSGVSLHWIDRGIDTGDIIAQEKVPVLPPDTGETLYRRLEEACRWLFINTWPKIKAGTIQVIKQDLTQGSSHRTNEVNQIDAIDLDRTYKARDLINILRARTFPPYTGAYFVDGGKKIYIEVRLTEETRGEES